MKRWRTAKGVPMGVLIAREQSEPAAAEDFEKLVSRVSSGEVKGVIIQDQGAPSTPRGTHPIRRGAVKGAGFGFLIGLVPLAATTLAAAAAGGLLAKASEVRLERGTAPRLRFSKPPDGG